MTQCGRPKKSEFLKAKNYTFKLYDWEIQKVKNFLKIIRQEHTLMLNDYKGLE